MSEVSIEQIEETAGLTEEQRQKWERQKATLRSQGIPLTRDVIRSMITAIKFGVSPTMMSPDTAGSRESRENVRTGKNIVDSLPEEYQDNPDVPLQRKYTQIEKEMLEVMKQSDLKNLDPSNPYRKPPGEELKVNKDGTHVLDWAKYGWAAAEKSTVERLFAEKFGLHNRQRTLAMEVLLLNGYTANDVSAKLNTFALPDHGRREDRWRYFKELFSRPDDPLPESSLNVVFNEERHESQDIFQGRNPENIEDLAWQMSWTGDAGGNAKWMVGGKHALLELRMKTKAEREKDMREKGDKSWGKYYVNENNLLEWYRNELDLLWDIHGPNTPIQVNDFIKMRKGGFYEITFRSIIEQRGQIFNSEDKKTSYEQTWLNLQWEANTFQTLYDNDIIYRQASGMGMEEWMKQYEQMTLMNPLTKLGFRTNMLQRLLTGTQDYKEGRAEFDQAKYLSDNVLGGAFTEMVLAFYNLGDFSELQKVLGKNSSFFTRAGWMQAIRDVAAVTAKRTGGAVVMAPETQAAFEKAFAKGSNTITDKQAFIEFINFCTTNLPGAYQELFVNKAVENSVKARFKAGDRAGFGLTAAQAWFFNRFMGGLARNDIGTATKTDSKGREFSYPSPSVHDKLSELINMRANREKYSQGEGKPYGNLQTLNKHLAAAILPMLGVVTQQEVYALDEYGRKILDAKGKPLMKRKSVLQVFQELHTLRVKQQERLDLMNARVNAESDPGKRAVLQAQVAAEEKRHRRTYMDIVGRDVTFRENAHREYTQVHLKPGYKWMQRIMSGKGLDFSKFNTYDPWGGVTFKREEFIKEVQSELIGTVRDMFRKYKWMNMNEDVRMPFMDPKTGKMAFRNGKLAQQLFGYDVLNHEAFWQRDSRGRAIKRYGFASIDFNKVEKNRHQLMKQVFMTEVAADIYNHQLQNSGDQRFNNAYYLNMIDALEAVSGRVVVEELAKHGIHVTESFLNKKDIAWLKARALNGKILWWDAGAFGFHLKWWITSLWDPKDKEGLGFGRMFSIIAKEAFAGGVTA